ncbi:MAG: alpha-ribazole phosphatase [Actinomycetota bacterium]|nr:alpha-ribazole phosphatase [Actinomycetota bacterium]
MLKVTLARHAETIWNEQLRYIGRTDLDLSPLGRNNAELLADHFRDVRLDAVYASDMKRAGQTAGAVAQTHGLPVQREPLLNEIDFGAWEGLTHKEIAAAYPGTVEKWLADPFTVDIPGGEPWPVFADRVRRGWENITRSARGHILIVTHAGCIKAILGRIMELDGAMWWNVYQDKGALNHIVVDRGSARIIRINDIDYRRTKIPGGEREPYAIERCDIEGAPKIHFVIRKAAVAYAPIMGPGFDAEKYMSPAELEAEMGRMTFYAAVNGGLVVGVMGLELVENNVALVRHAYVLPACQRLGLGGRLLSRVEAEARSPELDNAADGVLGRVSRLLVGTYADNAGATAFYKKHGFKSSADPQALLAKYWDIPRDQASRSIVLEKDLGA